MSASPTNPKPEPAPKQAPLPPKPVPPPLRDLREGQIPKKPKLTDRQDPRTPIRGYIPKGTSESLPRAPHGGTGEC